MAAEQEDSEIGHGDSLLDSGEENEESTSAANVKESLEGTSTVLKKKRKRSELRDPNAPKRPCSAYIYFSNDARQKMREDKADSNLTMAEKSKLIGKDWAVLPLEQKKKYQARADADKQRYIQEYVAYQQTDVYKAFMRTKHPTLKKARGEEKATGSKHKKRSGKDPVSEKPTKAPAKLPLSCQQQFIPGSQIPIFSEEFLQHNKDLETQLRKLRQSSANLEEENALLSRHVESMKVAVERVQNEVMRQEQKNMQTKAQLDTVREVLVDAFKDVILPDTNETPSIGTVDKYIAKLEVAVTEKPEENPALVARVSSITKHVEKMLKEKITRGLLESLLEKSKERMNQKEDDDIDVMAVFDAGV